jgi:hypothetical protein
LAKNTGTIMYFFLEPHENCKTSTHGGRHGLWEVVQGVKDEFSVLTLGGLGTSRWSSDGEF